MPETVYRLDGFNSNGDVTAHYADSTTMYRFAGRMTDVSGWNESFFNYYLQQIDELEQRGVKVLILPTPLAKSEYEASRDKFDYAVAKINASRHPYALPFDEYILADSLFYDTPYHLRHPGAIILSRRLSALISCL